MRIDKNPSPKVFELTPERFRMLVQLAKEDKSFSAAAVHIGCDRKTLRKACEQQGLGRWVDDKFPPTGKGPIAGAESKTGAVVRKLKAEQIAAPIEVPGGVQVKWLTRDWRGAA
jgi:hypothetical protein